MPVNLTRRPSSFHRHHFVHYGNGQKNDFIIHATPSIQRVSSYPVDARSPKVPSRPIARVKVTYSDVLQLLDMGAGQNVNAQAVQGAESAGLFSFGSYSTTTIITKHSLSALWRPVHPGLDVSSIRIPPFRDTFVDIFHRPFLTKLSAELFQLIAWGVVGGIRPRAGLGLGPEPGPGLGLGLGPRRDLLEAGIAGRSTYCSVRKLARLARDFWRWSITQHAWRRSSLNPLRRAERSGPRLAGKGLISIQS